MYLLGAATGQWGLIRREVLQQSGVRGVFLCHILGSLALRGLTDEDVRLELWSRGHAGQRLLWQSLRMGYAAMQGALHWGPQPCLAPLEALPISC